MYLSDKSDKNPDSNPAEPLTLQTGQLSKQQRQQAENRHRAAIIVAAMERKLAREQAHVQAHVQTHRPNATLRCTQFNAIQSNAKQLDTKRLLTAPHRPLATL